MQGVRGGGK